jgi:hypothetical protein
MDGVNGTKSAPAKMRYFLADLLLDLSVRGKVLSVEVEDPATYLVTLLLAGRGVTVHHLSAWEMSRGLRGDPDALALLRAGLLGEAPAAS